MNKKAKYLVLPLLIISGLILFNNIVNTKADNIEEISYSQKSIIDEMNDGWMYTFDIIYLNDDSDKVYMFDGYNLKYDEMDNCYIPIIDRQTGEEIDRVKPSYVSLSTLKNYKEDIVKIVEYFNEKQFNENITSNDLNELNISSIDKEYLVDIFNRTLNSELKTIPGDYLNSRVIDNVMINSSDENISGKWKLSYLIDYGTISKVNIEFIDENGNYLFDNQDQVNLLSNENNFSDNIKNLEENIIYNQRFSLNTTTYNNSVNSYNNDINNLLNEAQQKLNS